MLFDSLNHMFGETVRVVIILEMVALVGVGLFLVDYHRRETPSAIKALLWSYMVTLSGGALGVMLNVVASPGPTPGSYAIAVVSGCVVAYLSCVAVKSIQNR